MRRPVKHPQKRRIERREVLPMTLNREPFDAIIAGDKKTEYRQNGGRPGDLGRQLEFQEGTRAHGPGPSLARRARKKDAGEAVAHRAGFIGRPARGFRCQLCGSAVGLFGKASISP
jgi:hypothetical protein